MKKKLAAYLSSATKKLLLGIGGLIAYIGAPMAPIAYYWGFLVHKDAQTTLSTISMLFLLTGLPVFKLVFRKDKIPFDVNMLYIAALILCYALEAIIKPLKVVLWFAVGGSIGGSFLIKRIAKIEKTEQENKLAEKTAEKLHELEKLKKEEVKNV